MHRNFELKLKFVKFQFRPITHINLQTVSKGKRVRVNFLFQSVLELRKG